MLLNAFLILMKICIVMTTCGMLAILMPGFMIAKDVSYVSGILLGAFSFSMSVLWIAKIDLMLNLLVSVKLAVVSAVVYAVAVLAVLLIWNKKKAACS